MTLSEKKQKEKPDKSASANLSDSIFSHPESSSVSETDASYLDTSCVCSATDCTGLIPSLPDSEAELDAYEEMYQFCLKGKNQAF